MSIETKYLSPSQFISRWIIVEEDVERKTMAKPRVMTQISGHFNDRDMALCSLDGLLEEEKSDLENIKKNKPFLKFHVFAQPGFMFRKRGKEKYCYIAPLH